MSVRTYTCKVSSVLFIIFFVPPIEYSRDIFSRIQCPSERKLSHTLDGKCQSVLHRFAFEIQEIGTEAGPWILELYLPTELQGATLQLTDWTDWLQRAALIASKNKLEGKGTWKIYNLNIINIYTCGWTCVSLYATHTDACPAPPQGMAIIYNENTE